MLHISPNPAPWRPFTQDDFDRLHARYLTWIDDLTGIRKRMDALRDETKIGWVPSPTTTASLNDLNKHDERFAARDMDGARHILDAAEADAATSKPHRLARIERAKERIATLEAAYRDGWRPLAGLKWPHPDVVAWTALFSGIRFWHLDELETVIVDFEHRLAREPATTEQLADFDKRLQVLRQRYRFGWRPFGRDPRASQSAAMLEDWCASSGRPDGPQGWFTYVGVRPGRQPHTAMQIDLWLSHFETASNTTGLNTNLNLGPKLLGRKNFRK